MKIEEGQDWLYEITPKAKLIDLNFGEIWRYRDLLWLFVKRDIVTVYKQTVLGPLWYLIQPLFTSIIFTLVFNSIANIKTGGIDPFLFNLAGITAWNYFKTCLTSTSNTFRANAGIFGKVYFPRVIVPLSQVISNLLKFGIQILILIVFYVYNYHWKDAAIFPDVKLLLFPLYVLIMGLLGLGFGMIISAWTTKYRDFTILLGFATQLLMYVSAVPFPLSEIQKSDSRFVWLVEYNPLTQVIEGFRYIIFGTGYFNWTGFLTTLAFSIVIFLIGLVIFNRTEKTFIDTV